MNKIKQIIFLFTASILLSLMSGNFVNAKVSKYGDFKYIIKDTGITITKYTGKSKVVNIPDSIDGMPVDTIGNGAFEYNKHIVKVTIPDSIKSIGDSAFGECKSLQNVNMPSSVKIIKERCFSRCISLKSIELSNVRKICSNAFSYCKSLGGKLALNNIREIENNAFYKCTGIIKAKFSDKLCIYGSSYDANIQGNPFSLCKSLISVDIDSSNTEYKSVDGIVYSNDDNWLVTYPAGKCSTVKLENHSKGIASYAFSGATIGDFIISEETMYVGNNAFYKSSISSITIPHCGNTCRFEYNVFRKCNRLTTVVFDDNIKSINND